MKATDILAIAKKHTIKHELAAPDFFEGALMGNGNLGLVVCSRPDGIVFYLGHNDIWDIRIEEGHKDKIGTFQEIWERILSTSGDIHNEKWYQDYEREVTASYHNYIYPRPYPASSTYLFWDKNEYEVIGHSLDISKGLLTITLQNSDGEPYYLSIFVAQDSDTIYCRATDSTGKDTPIFTRIRLLPHTPDEGLPEYTVLDNGFIQLLPYNGYTGEPRPGVDKGFSVLYKTNGQLDTPGLISRTCHVSAITLQLSQGYYDQVCHVEEVSCPAFEEALQTAETSWENYWKCSGVRLEDSFLEHIWYTNTYFLRCLLNSNSKCPGLFGNWMYGNIGTAWHGDYHMNYNTQQVFWGLMSANRQELHLPYLKLAEELLPLSMGWAKDFYHLDGACFPHSAYPVPMSVMPYPSPDWGWEIFETPWTVQSLWWHYTYTRDIDLLKERIYPVIKEAVLFLVQYMTRDGANPNNDNKYHLFPTIVPELYGLTENLKLNLDGAVDLAFTKFIFRAMLQAIEDLGLAQEEAALAQQIQAILGAFPDYPTANSHWGKVYTSVQGEDPNHVIYNCPANLMQIFPGEDVDAQSASGDELEIARNSWRHHYNEGGNDLVFYHMIGARLQTIDLERFKRHIRYCLLPNGTATDKVMLTGGRYSDDTDFSFMGRMGIWIENFSLHSVITECLIWGHTDIVELFPNWDKQKDACFCSLRTKGAFLVDSGCAEGDVTHVHVRSEVGGEWKMKNPWNAAADQEGNIYTSPIISVTMQPGEIRTFRQHHQ